MTDNPDSPSDSAPAHIDERLDCTGLRCPLPLLRTKQLLHRMSAGGVLEVMATDAGAQRDIPSYLKLSPHRLLGQDVVGGHYLFWIERGNG